MRVHVLDGTYELFRNYFGRPKRAAPDGGEVGAVLGVVESVLSLLRQSDVTHLAVATDHVIESFRNDLFTGYKSSAGVPADLLAQFDPLEEALASLGLVVWPMVEFEADDAMATAASRFRDHAEQVVLLSPDKDLAQCVTGREVVTLDRRRGTALDAEGVLAKFGVHPPSIPDYLALVGDAADGIPGLPGWGAKSTAAVLRHHPHLEDIPEDPSAWGIEGRRAERLAAVLTARHDDAILYRTLATLRTDVGLAEEVGDLEWRGVPRDRFLGLCEAFGFGGVRSRPHRWA